MAVSALVPTVGASAHSPRGVWLLLGVAPTRVLLKVLLKYWEKRGMLVVLVAGGIGLHKLWAQKEELRTEQRRVFARQTTPTRASSITQRRPATSEHEKPSILGKDGGAEKKRSPIQVDGIFLRRLMRLLPVLVPSWRSKEALLLVTETAMLVSRSLLSIHISELIGDGLQAVMKRSPELFLATLSDFFVSGIISSVANSALKYLGNLMTCWFRENLTREVHRTYMMNDNYYRAAVLAQATGREGKLDNLDQRIVSDLHNFTKTLADLYSRTFKPALDVILCTRSMTKSIGWKGPLLMYSYFVFASAGLRAISPSIAKFTAQQQAVEGDFRRSHARLLAHAEEVAFIAGAPREQAILDEQLQRVSSFAEFLSLKQLHQGIMDQFGLKYLASCVGWPIIALPFILYEQSDNQVEWLARYRVADDLIRQASASFGDLMLVHKKLQTLSGFTARVVELVEMLDAMPSSEQTRTKSSTSKAAITATGVTITTPDGDRTLVSDLDLALNTGDSLLITGPNGAGKTSLFRTLAGLWPCREGAISGPRPADRELFYLPQTPYLVVGSLRDQVIYPDSLRDAALRHGGEEELDAAVRSALESAGLERFVQEGLDRFHDEWDDVASGGEKQRLGWARIFYHAPAFAALDEATAAVDVQQEGPLYQNLLDRGVTILSIAHKPTVRKYHKWELNLSGDGTGHCGLTPIQH